MTYLPSSLECTTRGPPESPWNIYFFIFLSSFGWHTAAHLTGVSAPVLVAGTHEDLRDNLHTLDFTLHTEIQIICCLGCQRKWVRGFRHGVTAGCTWHWQQCRLTCNELQVGVGEIKTSFFSFQPFLWGQIPIITYTQLLPRDVQQQGTCSYTSHLTRWGQLSEVVTLLCDMMTRYSRIAVWRGAPLLHSVSPSPPQSRIHLVHSNERLAVDSDMRWHDR